MFQTIIIRARSLRTWLLEYPAVLYCLNRKSILCLIYLKYQRMGFSPSGHLICLLFPCIVRFDESSMDFLLRSKPHIHSFRISFVRAKVIPFPFKSNPYAIISVFHLKYSAKPAGIIPAEFPFFQDFYACAVHPVKLIRDLFLILPFQTAAAKRIPLHQAIFRNFCFISTVALTSPVNGPLSVSSVCRLYRKQSSKLLSRQIHPVMLMIMGTAAAAFYLPGLQISGRSALYLPTVTTAQPAGPFSPGSLSCEEP